MDADAQRSAIADLAIQTGRVSDDAGGSGWSGVSGFAQHDMSTQTPPRPAKRKLPLSMYKQGFAQCNLSVSGGSHVGRQPLHARGNAWSNTLTSIQSPLSPHGGNAGPGHPGLAWPGTTFAAACQQPLWDHQPSGCGHIKRQRTPLPQAAISPMPAYRSAGSFMQDHRSERMQMAVCLSLILRFFR